MADLAGQPAGSDAQLGTQRLARIRAARRQRRPGQPDQQRGGAPAALLGDASKFIQIDPCESPRLDEFAPARVVQTLQPTEFPPGAVLSGGPRKRGEG